MLHLLHATEFLLADVLLLVEKDQNANVHTLVPFLPFGIYLGITFHLPNRAFYPLLRDQDTDMMVTKTGSVLIYVMLEVGSLVLFSRILQRKLRLSVYHQLGFVLESQWRQVQSKLVFWIVICILGLTIASFSWLKHK
uniref:Uncharacterized protein n=1 Tax=Globisporangium ultimum (strain ATCC 200006 / CBS 805.95 / DAOM BR144) TaxID=431595 RepID=K3X2L2_GLOUD